MDVEAILEQIRERVIAEDEAPVSSAATTIGAPANGSGSRSSLNESLTRASAHLAVTGRAWDRLPPVFSNRSGTLARVELWLKRTCKPLTRWFTWEQINFNRAVNDALCDVIEILKIEAHELEEFARLRSEIEESDRARHQLETRLDQTDARLREMLGGHSQLAGKLDELAEALRAEQQTGLAELAAELREDQRVCFRQLSLEASESAVLEDRGRRELLARLEKLEASQQRR
jgi:hypothetical protein